MPHDRLTPVGKTALAVARARAEESTRADRLFEDPYASAFVEAAPESAPEQPADSDGANRLRDDLATHIVTRTRFFDRYLLDACAHGCRQVVLLAAGLDTRAFRLDWPDDVRLFEVDRADILGFKRDILDVAGAAPVCERTIIQADLSERWEKPLVAAGFDRTVPTVWLAEGLMVYLSADDAAGLLTTIGDLSAPGSRLSFERSPRTLPTFPDWALSMPQATEFASLWKGGLGEDASQLLEQQGWAVTLTGQQQLTRSYGRAPQTDIAWGFLTAAR
ncbi:SAM-dependent methyltransferase [Rhodococcus marinonascens]|uniref:SAM-dependent methyltransferase n=1 Tax=Rhodococcus marinonascens TaxID=38311 RepID=UPI00093352D0|nr:SAM-dependent methyltransferase [Rhodococcus marinonascens]